MNCHQIAEEESLPLLFFWLLLCIMKHVIRKLAQKSRRQIQSASEGGFREMTVQKNDNKMTGAIALICVVSVFLFSQDAEQKLPFGSLCVAVAGIVACAALLFVRKRSWAERRPGVLCCAMGLFTVILIRWASWFKTYSAEQDTKMLTEGFLVFCVVFLWLFFCIWLEKGFTEELVLLILFGAFAIRLFYAVMVQAHIYQNDVGGLFPGNEGHLGYVYSFYSTWRMPKENPMEYYQYYQAPFFHIISAVFVKLFTVIGFVMDEINELLQIVSVLYGTLTLFFVNKIGRKLKVPVWSRAVVMGIAGFLPWGIIQGAALNNDGLMVLFDVMALYFTLVWYEESKYSTILIMAVCIGCSMMTKISGALAAPAMAVLMLHKVWKERKQWTSYLKQFLCFGAVAFPLGLWYPVRQFILYRMPPGFVPRIPETDMQFIGMYSKWQRFFDFSNAFESLSLRWNNTEAVDYNIPISLVKFAAFGEGNYCHINRVLTITGTILFWMTLVILALMAVVFILWLFVGRQQAVQKVFISVLFAVSLFSYVKFNLAYPFVCTMHIRYIMLAVYFGFLVLGLFFGEIEERFLLKRPVAKRVLRITMATAAGIYMTAAVTMIVQLVQIIP